MPPNSPKNGLTPSKPLSKEKSTMIKLDKFLYRNATFCFAIFLGCAVWAFWPKYFSHVLNQQNVRFHTHGISMTLWCLMLIGQAYLIRTNRRSLHRAVGKFSYLLVPVIVLTTVNIAHFRLHHIELRSIGAYYSVALQLNSILSFVVLYGLAMYFRHQPLVHARYMVCTVFPMFPQITSRIVVAHFKSVFQYFPMLNSKSLPIIMGFALADLLLLILLFWDWRTNRRLDVFPIALGVLLFSQLLTVTLYQFSFWQDFCVWFHGLPFS